ncbi:MAG: NADH-quinone oxidoreductase subunit NuoH [Planctomycetes bacterium]|jgi:NADH-quinone oxidoreductase subunit H|nr:NADH-quinone oxidoreductase subunit NuoH [Planctomycetota bacterium]MDP6424306.1 NADH-quinone oxidoreductase subunit NuoH [Planctomycetota bacterium]
MSVTSVCLELGASLGHVQDGSYDSRGLFKDWDWFGREGLWGFVGMALSLAIIVGVCSVVPILFVWVERRGSGRIHQRKGPNRVGPFGLLQTLADGIKLMFKEDIIPANASRFLFMIAPGLVLAGVFAAFALLPLSSTGVIVDAPLGIYIIAAVLSLEVIGVIMAGWASNNKWAILGAMREAAQMISYEVPMGLCILLAIICHDGELSLRAMSENQAGGFLNVGNWLIFSNPLFAFPAFVIFFIACLANTKRAPFDLPEAESELVSGFHTEYSGIRFSFFFLEEYASMFLVSAVTVMMFLGGWNIPFVPGEMLTGGFVGEVLAIGSTLVKTFFLVWVMIWVRWTLPRIRVDQVMTLCYKYLTPLAFLCLLGSCFWEA